MDWLSLASNAVKLLAALAQYINAQRDYNSGYAGATNYAFLQAAKQLSAAAEELANADKFHAQDKTDGAFDKDFKRID